MSYLIDTNVFLRIANPADPHRSECAAALDLLRGTDEAFTCAQVLIEYWVGATRPSDVNGLGLDTAQVARNLKLMVRMFPCLPEPPNIAAIWERVATEHDVKGKQAHDARIAALMLAHGVTHILTLNPAHFARYSEVTPVAPQEIVSH